MNFISQVLRFTHVANQEQERQNFPAKNYRSLNELRERQNLTNDEKNVI